MKHNGALFLYWPRPRAVAAARNKQERDMLILGIETSCDETSLALVEAEGARVSPRFRVLRNLVSSQIKIHAPFGGVVPNLAKREHTKNLPVLLRQIFGISKFQIQKIDMIAVTVGPGLEPALWTGIAFAQELHLKLKAKKSRVKITGANHLEGHLYSFLLPPQKKIALFPAVHIIASGGHTILVLMQSLTAWKKLGETRDDAAGEAFDKTARVLGLPYPGGPEIEKLARNGNPSAITFPRPMLNQKNYDFSFSGLKTAVLYYLRGLRNKNKQLADVAASFQSAAIDVLVQKTIRAAKEFGAKSIMLSGGVAANTALRTALRQNAKKINAAFLAPGKEYITDNAAMIAAAGYITHTRKNQYKLRANGNLSI